MVNSELPCPAGVIEVCGVDQLWDGEMERFRIGGTAILLVRLDGQFHAYQARCPHQGAELSDGELDDRVLTCAAHRWQFDATSGQGVNPRRTCLKRFPVHVEKGKVWIELQLGDVKPEAAAIVLRSG